MRRVFRGCAKKSADAIRGRSDLLDDLFEFLDHLSRFANHLRLIGNVWAQIEQIVANWIARWKRSDHAIELVEQRKIRRGLVETFELSAALFAHRKTQSMPESSAIITFPPKLRNVRRCALPKCSTSAVVSRLRKIALRRLFATANPSCGGSILRRIKNALQVVFSYRDAPLIDWV